MDKKQIKELVNNAKKVIKEANKLAKKNDISGAFQSYKRAADWLQKAGDMDLLQEVMEKMEGLAQPTQNSNFSGAILNLGATTPQAQPQASYQQQQQQAAYKQQQQQQAVYKQQQQAAYKQQQQQQAAQAAPSTTAPPARQAGGWTPLVFSHGQELEVQLVRKDGSFLSGEEMVHMMEEIVKDARMKLIQWIDNQQMPAFIAQKIGTRNLPLKTDEEKGLVLQVPYPLPDGNRLNIDSFGRDGNVAAITYILELVTPPCMYVEELAWWESTLFALAYEVLPSDLHIVSTALNPMQEYMRGLSFGDHSHIGTFNSPLEKMQFYDMIRNFIPAIISLSVNSPIMEGRPTDDIKIVKGRYAAPNCVRSIRLMKNTTMLSSNNPARYPPYLLDDTEENRQFFLQTLQKADFYDARFQDVYPFTDFGTIEVRICDAQLSVARRIGLSMLFQTLGYKTRKLLSQGKYVPGAASECLVKNREKAVRQGLFGTFTTEGIDEQAFRQYDQEFANMYLGKPGEKVRYMFQHVQRLLKYLAPEFKELGFANSPYLQPLLLSVFGEIPNITPPFTEAEFQLSLYAYKQSQRQDTNIVPDLINLSKKYALNNTQHPLAGRVNYPPEFQ